ncbi:Uncharacterised protein [uncultured archaeon]|nr:Uncharacterised protein [uncultured archaeon]
MRSLEIEKVFPDPFEEDEEEIIEDRMDEESARELAFEQGVEEANNEMVDDWKEEEELE